MEEVVLQFGAGKGKVLRKLLSEYVLREGSLIGEA